MVLTWPKFGNWLRFLRNCRTRVASPLSTQKDLWYVSDRNQYGRHMIENGLLSWDNILWTISSTIVFLAALYFIGFDLLVKYSDKAGSTLWTPSFQSTSERPLELPIIVVNVAGIPTNMTSPFQIILKKATDESTEDHIHCGPEKFQENCWGNSEVFYKLLIWFS